MIDKYLQQLVWVAVGCGAVVGEAAVEGPSAGVGRPLADATKKVILALALLKGSRSVAEGLAEGLAEFKLLSISFLPNHGRVSF